MIAVLESTEPVERDGAGQVVRDALKSDDKGHRLQAVKVMLTPTAEGKRRGWGAAIVDEPKPRGLHHDQMA
jgi:hypothetical protein